MLFGFTFIILGSILINMDESYEVEEMNDGIRELITVTTALLGYFCIALGILPAVSGVSSCLGACCVKNIFYFSF